MRLWQVLNLVYTINSAVMVDVLDWLNREFIPTVGLMYTSDDIHLWTWGELLQAKVLRFAAIDENHVVVVINW